VALTQAAPGAPVGMAANDKDLLVVGKDHVAASSFIVRSVSTHQLDINGVPQWQLVQDDAFSAVDLRGWANAGALMQCGPLAVLTVPEGGKIEVRKTVAQLPAHTQVRVVATVHFVDDWQGETAYLKLGDHYVWTDSHELRNSARALNVCGSEKFPETKFSAAIDVVLPATAAGKLDFAFGTTIEAGSLARFGVSAFAVYTRNAGH